MFDQGLVDEVRGLLREGLREGVTASRALGYAQVLAALDAGPQTGPGVDELRDAREQTYVGTRRYVRRQRSWFRRDHRVHWLDPLKGAADRARLVDDAVRAWRQVP